MAAGEYLSVIFRITPDRWAIGLSDYRSVLMQPDLRVVLVYWPT